MELHLSGVVAERFCSWELNGPHLTIGRSSRNSIQIADATVSKDHAEILFADGVPAIRDLGSRNGTRVNGTAALEPIPLKVGDRVEIGHVPLKVSEGDATPPTRLSESPGLSSSLKIPADKILSSVGTAGSGLAGPAATGIVQLLAEAGQMLVLPRSLKQTGDEILKIVEKAVPATRLILLLQPDPGAEPVQVAARYRGGNASQPLVLSRTIMKRVLEECTSILITDAAHDPRFLGLNSIIAMAVHTAIAVPLFDNEKVLGLLYADSHDLRTTYTQEHLEIMTLLANMAAVKITNLRLLEAEQIRARVAQELATARRIQRGLLPAEPPRIEGYDLEVFLETCYEVGGDLYDFYEAPDGSLYFLLGDVSGKGIGAAMLMTSVMSTTRVLFDNCSEPADIMNRLNAVIHRSTDSGTFVTAFLGRLDPATGRLNYVNAGHNPPFIVHGSDLRALDATGIPVGMLPGIAYDAGTVVIPPGAVVAVYTDGITEARCQGEFFEEDRLKQILLDNCEKVGPKELCADIIKNVNDFLAGGNREDDITLLLLRRRS